MAEQPFLVSRPEAARLLGLSSRTVDYLRSKGVLRARKIGRRALILRVDLERFARGESLERGKPRADVHT